MIRKQQHNYSEEHLNWIKMAVFHRTKHMRTCEPEAGGRLNKKDGLTRYGDSHVKDKTS